MTEHEMVGWHHQLSGHKLEQTLKDSEGQGSLACCSPWDGKESDTTECLDNNSSLMPNSKGLRKSHCLLLAHNCCPAILPYKHNVMN